MDKGDYYSLRLYLAAEISEIQELIQFSKEGYATGDFSKFDNLLFSLEDKYEEKISSITPSLDAIKLFKIYSGLEEKASFEMIKKDLRDLGEQNKN